MHNALLLCATVGIFLGSAPIVARFASLGAIMMAVLIAVGSVAAMTPVMFSQSFAVAGVRALSIGLTAGILNGAGLLAFYKIVAGAAEGSWDGARVLTIALVMIPVVITIESRIFFGEVITTEKIIGLVLACGAIWFLK